MTAPVVLHTSERPRVSVLVPTMKNPDLLARCLGSIERNVGPDVPFEVILVLNRPEPELARFVDERVRGARVVRSTVNLGVAGGGNLGRSAAAGELLVLLHDDAEVEPGWLESLVDAADREPSAGAIGSLVLNPDGSLQSAGNVLFSDGESSAPWPPGTKPDPVAFDRPRPVDYCGTISLLVSASVWDAIGGLDERIHPAYYVDVDLCLSVRRHGSTVLCEPRSAVRHRRGSSGDPRLRAFLTERHRRYVLGKWPDELATLEPPGRGDWSEAIAGALARAEARAREARAPSARGDVSSPAPRPEAADVAAIERRHLELALGVYEEWSRQLCRELDHLEDAVRRTSDAVAAQTADLEELRHSIRAADSALVAAHRELATLRGRSELLDAIEGSRWWRLRSALRPVLRRLNPRMR